MKDLQQFFKNVPLEGVTDKLKQYKIEFINKERFEMKNKNMIKYKWRKSDLTAELSYEGNDSKYSHLKGYKFLGDIIEISEMDVSPVIMNTIGIKVQATGSKLIDTYRIKDTITNEIVFECKEEPKFYDFRFGANIISINQSIIGYEEEEETFEFTKKDLSKYKDCVDELVVETDYKGPELYARDGGKLFGKVKSIKKEIDPISGFSKNLIEIEIKGTKGEKEVPFNIIYIKLGDKTIYTNFIKLEMGKASNYNLIIAQTY